MYVLFIVGENTYDQINETKKSHTRTVVGVF